MLSVAMWAKTIAHFRRTRSRAGMARSAYVGSFRTRKPRDGWFRYESSNYPGFFFMVNPSICVALWERDLEEAMQAMYIAQRTEPCIVARSSADSLFAGPVRDRLPAENQEGHKPDAEPPDGSMHMERSAESSILTAPRRVRKFAKGRCFRGSECRYVHEVPPCHRFQRGRCNRESCRYAHSL